MKTILTLLLVTLCAATSYGQTIKTLGYNASNGRVVYSGTNTLAFSNAVSFENQITIGSDMLYTGSGFEGFGKELNFEEDYWSGNSNRFIFEGFSEIEFANFPLNFGSSVAIAQTRTNLGIPLAALTNTSNVTMMRALSGSTNTNHPFSGSISVTGTNNTNTLVFSNGILQSVQ